MLERSSGGPVELLDPLEPCTSDNDVQCWAFSWLNIFVVGTAGGVSTEIAAGGSPCCSDVAKSAVATVDSDCSGG